jgi:hypothetical protein
VQTIWVKLNSLQYNNHQLVKYGQSAGLMTPSTLHNLCSSQDTHGTNSLFILRKLTSPPFTVTSPRIVNISIACSNLSREKQCLTAYVLRAAMVFGFFRMRLIRSRLLTLCCYCSSSSFSWKSAHTFAFFFSPFFSALIRLKLASALS